MYTSAELTVTTATEPVRFRLHELAVRAVSGCLLVATCTVAAGAQAAPSAPETLESPKPFTEWSHSVHAFRDSLVAIAKAQVGTRYVRGGQTPERGFDCSGLVRYVMAGLRIDVPRTAAQQAGSGRAVSRDKSRLRPGDLLTFGPGKRGVSHIGIYVGNGRYVHASSVAGRVSGSRSRKGP
jgi:cell wall-associated NlpC family hydrolase